MSHPDELEKVEDPLRLFWLTTDAIEHHKKQIDRLAEIRSRSIAALHASGYSYRDLAEVLGISAPRVGQLVSSNEPPILEILKSWVSIERNMSLIAEASSADDEPDLSYSKALKIIRQSPRFDDGALSDLKKLRILRNQVVHGRYDATVEDAEFATDKTIYLNALLHLVLSDVTSDRRVDTISSSLVETRIARLERQCLDLAKKETAAREKEKQFRADAAKKLSRASSSRQQSQQATAARAAARRDKEADEWRRRAEKFASDRMRKEAELKRAKSKLR
ncbi:hypothetical protein [Actinomadura formosensis]|uniref:hypothetical protein n=1 Tax=Actinomadura formosensis TaxID=60706 RepID=UPI003D8A745B